MPDLGIQIHSLFQDCIFLHFFILTYGGLVELDLFPWVSGDGGKAGPSGVA